MSLLGTIVNAAAILLGGAIGLLLTRGLPERISKTLMNGVGLVVIYIGVSGSLKGQNTLIAVLSMVIGGGIGAWLNIDLALERLGAKAQQALLRGREDGSNRFAEGFVSASLLFCVGAMAIVGSLQSGIAHDHSTLFTKAILDGVSALVLASTFGPGVLLSAAAVLVYQGAITLAATFVAPLLSETVIAELTCVGSLLIVGIGLNEMGITKLKLANYLPALFLPILFCRFM